MSSLEDKLDYYFKDATLLQTALTHTSFANEAKPKAEHNERLEFLGDAVLSFIVSGELYDGGKLPEGELTRRRAALVREEALAAFARSIGLGQHLRLGRGEDASGGRDRDSILSDAFEALIAALYLDGGIRAAERLILPLVRAAAPEKAQEDFKTRLQEKVQKHPGQSVEYTVVAEQGPDHDKQFTVEARQNGACIGTGRGHSKKLAEQAAAKQALERLGHHHNQEN